MDVGRKVDAEQLLRQPLHAGLSKVRVHRVDRSSCAAIVRRAAERKPLRRMADAVGVVPYRAKLPRHAGRPLVQRRVRMNPTFLLIARLSSAPASPTACRATR
jgi:hypothetical protein